VTRDPIAEWLDGDGAASELAAGLEHDPAARRRLVDAAFVEAVLPRALAGLPATARQGASRRAFVAGAVVCACAGAFLWWWIARRAPGTSADLPARAVPLAAGDVLAAADAPRSFAGASGLRVDLEPRARAVVLAAPGDALALRDGAAVVAAARDRGLRVDVPGGIVIDVRPGGVCRVRVAADAPDAADVEVRAGAARVLRDGEPVDLGAGEWRTVGDRAAVVKLGPRVAGTIDAVEDRAIVVGGHGYRVSRSARITVDGAPADVDALRPGVRVALTIIGEDEVLVVAAEAAR